MRTEDNYSVAQQVWQDMLHLAMPVVECYWTDLWHDAIVLDKKFPKAGEGNFPQEPVELIYTVRTHGTWLFDRKDVDGQLERQLRSDAAQVYQVKVTPDVDRENCRIEWEDIT